jgi:putative heme-binding domain-containing protein
MLVNAAIEALGHYQDDVALTVLRRLSEKPATAASAIEALMSRRPRQAATSAMVALRSGKLSEQAVARIVAAFLRRQNGESLFVEALGDGSLPPDAAKVGLREVTQSGREFPELNAALTRAGGISPGPKVLSAEEMAELVQRVHDEGDPGRGEDIFRRSDLACFKCHAIGNAGGQVGSNLISLGATAQIDYLIDSILQPNKQVKENYHTLVVATVDGEVFSGIQVRQTDTDLLLRDAEDREISVPLAQIEDRSLGVSLMPAGLADRITDSELVDLVAFLSALGRVPEFTVSQTPLARRWEVMLPTEQAQFWLRRTSYASAATDHPSYTWQTVYSTVDGQLPLADLPEVSVRNRVTEGNRGMSFVRCELEASAATSVELQLNSTEGLSGWLDEQPLTLSRSTPLELSAGRHRLTLAIDRAVREKPLKLELNGDAEGLQFAGGR